MSAGTVAGRLVRATLGGLLAVGALAGCSVEERSESERPSVQLTPQPESGSTVTPTPPASEDAAQSGQSGQSG